MMAGREDGRDEGVTGQCHAQITPCLCGEMLWWPQSNYRLYLRRWPCQRAAKQRDHWATLPWDRTSPLCDCLH